MQTPPNCSHRVLSMKMHVGTNRSRMFNLVRSAVWKVAKFAALMAATVVVALLVARAYTALQGPALRSWHTFVPTEMDIDTLRTANWANYLQTEDEIFQSVQREVVAKLEHEDRAPANRYFEGSPLYSARFDHDWNRSFVLMPKSEPIGAAVFLHGLTDSPYSLRHIAERYSAHGFVAVAIRLPGHGTVPGARSRGRLPRRGRQTAPHHWLVERWCARAEVRARRAG